MRAVVKIDAQLTELPVEEALGFFTGKPSVTLLLEDDSFEIMLERMDNGEIRGFIEASGLEIPLFSPPPQAVA